MKSSIIGLQSALFIPLIISKGLLERITHCAKAGGYPNRYTAQAKDILPELDGEPPEANAVWSCGHNDQLSDAWSGKTAKDQELMQSCLPDEWLIIEAWDES